MGDLDTGAGSQDVVISGISGNTANVTNLNELRVKDINPYEDEETGRVIDTIQIADGLSTAQNKINYTVPVGKVFWVQSWNTAIEDGDKYIFELQKGGTALDFQGASTDGTNGNQYNTPNNNPWGIPAGTEVRVRRVRGDSGKLWGASIIGYLEDA